MEGSRWHKKNPSWSRWSRVQSAMARTLSLLPEDGKGEDELFGSSMTSEEETSQSP